MVTRVEAHSLDTLTRLADDPPLHIRRYPPVPPPPHDPNYSSSTQLKLYIVRVPNSQDVILTTLKPRSNTVTAQDIISCLYYLRIQPLDNATVTGASKPRSQSLQTDTLSPRSFNQNDRPGYQTRASFSGESSRSDHLLPGGTPMSGGGLFSPSAVSLTSVGSGGSIYPNGGDFEITFIRRDRPTGSQSTVGRIYSNLNTPLDTLPGIANSYAAAMMAQEARDSKKGRRDRKRLNLEIWTPGYRKFLCHRPGVPVEGPDTRPSTGRGEEAETGFKDLLWPAPVPPPPPGMEDVGPPPPPKHDMVNYPLELKAPQPINPAMARLSRFTEIYSPDTPVPTPTAPPKRRPAKGAIQELEGDLDDTFKRTLNLEGEGFWKSTGKRLSAFGGHRRNKSQPDSVPQYGMQEETRLAMEKMGLHTPSPSPYAPSCSTPGSDKDKEKETKGKGYTFDPPLTGTGKCEFETNSVGRKIRLKLYPNNTVAGSPFGNPTVVKADPILLATLSFQPPEGHGNARSPSPSSLGGAGGNGHGRSSSRFNFGEKFKKLHREGSWTEHVEQEAGSGLRSKLGSLLVEGEGMDVLDLVVVSSMGVFWKKYLDWSAELKEGW
ncbi:hypothetical protein ABW19_dt0207526 [Dactylella cylindrospora]|nr:hypothetical protein ABW19_dt0207526 [Dactylella cylindrospora]